MATIKHNGMELEEITEPQIFDPPRKMMVWSYRDGEVCDFCEREVIAILPVMRYHAHVVCRNGESLWWGTHCAPIPEKPAPRRATNRELAKWLAQGNGEVKYASQYAVKIKIEYGTTCDNDPCDESFKVRKWDDTEWHEPDVAYMGIEVKDEK